MRSLTVKITIILVLITLSSIGVIAVFAQQIAASEFDDYVLGQNEVRLLERLTEAYEDYGGWEEARLALIAPNNRPSQPPPGAPGGPGQANNNGRGGGSGPGNGDGPGNGGGGSDRNNNGDNRNGDGSPDRAPIADLPIDFALADASGLVVMRDKDNEHPIGSQFTTEDIENAIEIEQDDATIGYVLLSRLPEQTQTDEYVEFIQQVNQSLFLAAVVMSLLTLPIGILLARTVVRPVRELTAATNAMAAGDLEQTVPIRSKDEIGQLATSFNAMNVQLAQAQELRRQMTADIAHDLRTPLSVILSHTEGLSDGVLPANQETFHIIQDEALRLNQLIEDLRTLSLSEAGELTLHKQSMDLTGYLKRTLTSYQPYAEQRQMTLIDAVPDDLPRVEMDPDRMRQVFNNLLINALEYVQEGGIIRLTARKMQQAVQVMVQDNGPGVPEDEVPYLFERLYRADKSRQRHKGGSGLGLAIARSIVEAHGGTIDAMSKPGKGMQFIVTLPA